ncbi:hypothetical protein [Nocardiopsis oceani]
MKRVAALTLMTLVSGAAIGMAASPAAAGDKGYDGYYDVKRTVVEQGHGYGYWDKGDKHDKGYWYKDKDDKGKDWGWRKDKDKGYGYY